eukprot:CAMPEP_0176190918 /NCGR_PEP_ID=MMETSP0121_2-20121125/4195_1 /TAXON_ID=160619 /ORGANISM="Kryptoperidinium foliaceum, Strain CCMP 1326" /LENGTH=117 /DNA_ID=CAMNT_0017529573 /DNA_START=1 /DNA_END=350 /DNA_ORIENTATION=-
MVHLSTWAYRAIAVHTARHSCMQRLAVAHAEKRRANRLCMHPPRVGNSGHQRSLPSEPAPADPRHPSLLDERTMNALNTAHRARLRDANSREAQTRRGTNDAIPAAESKLLGLRDMA